jgi:hypothetical protein
VTSSPPGWGPPPPPGSQGPPPGPGWGAPAWDAPGWGAPPGYGPPPGYGYGPPLPKAGSARTGPLPLHPMTFGDILDGAFKLLKANLRTIVLVAATFLIPVNLLAGFFQRDLLGGYSLFRVLQDPSLAADAVGPSNGQLFGTLVAVLASVLVTPFVGGAVSRVVASSYLGDELEPGPAIRVTGRRFLALLGAFACTALLKLVGLLFCFVGVLVPMTFFLVTTPAVVVEELGPIRAMARSANLLRPRFWPVMGIAVVSGLMASVLANILSTPFTFLALAIGYHWGWILVAVGSILPALLTTPFVSVVATLVYFDARIRNEGFDLQMIAADLARGRSAPAP